MAATSSQAAGDLSVRDLLAGVALSTIATAGLFVLLLFGVPTYEWLATPAGPPQVDDPPLTLLLEVVEFASLPAAVALLLSAAALPGAVWVQRHVRRVGAQLAVYTAAGATLGTLVERWLWGDWLGAVGLATALGAGVAVAARALAAWASRRPAVPVIALVVTAVAVAAPGAWFWIGELVAQLT